MRLWHLALLFSLAWACASPPLVRAADPPIQPASDPLVLASGIAVVPESATEESRVASPSPPPAVVPEEESGAAGEGTAPIMDSDDSWVESLLRSDPFLETLLADAESLRMQILVGEIDRSTAEPSVHFHPFRLEADYIYPASAIKTLGALAALQTYAELRQEFPSLGLDTVIEFSGLATSHQDALGEPVVVSVEDRSTLREEIERALIVSSNEGFNRLWDLAGHEGINQRAWDVGLRSVRMRHRLSRQGRPEEAHRLAPSIRAEIDGQWVELLPQRESGLVVEDNSHPDVLIGRAHIAALTDDLVAEPLDFSAKNATSLLDLLSLVAWVVEPALVPHVDLGLSEPDREFLLEIMSHIPDEVERFKPFSPGVLSTVDLGSLTYVNKAGRAYGFHLDAAYIRDEATGRDFLLAASLHTNPNGVMNDSRYAYEDVSFPFLVALGAAVTERFIR